MALTGTGISLGNTEFGGVERYARGATSDGTTAYNFGRTQGYILNIATGESVASGSTLPVSGSVRAAAYHNDQVLVCLDSRNIHVWTPGTGFAATPLISNLRYFTGAGNPVVNGFESHGGQLYVTDDNRDTLYRVNANGQLVNIGSGYSNRNIGGLVSHNGQLLATDNTNDRLIAFNTVSGNPANVANNALPGARTIDFLLSHGELYGGQFSDGLLRFYDIRWDDDIEFEVDEGEEANFDLNDSSDDADTFSFSTGYTPPSWLELVGDTLHVRAAPLVDADTDYEAELTATRDGVTEDTTVTVRSLNTGTGPTWHDNIPAFSVDEGFDRSVNLAAYLTGATSLAFAPGYTAPSWLSISALRLVVTSAPLVNADTDFDVQLRASNAGGSSDETVVVSVQNVPLLPAWDSVIPRQDIDEGVSGTIDIGQYVGDEETITFQTGFIVPDWLTISGGNLVYDGTQSVDVDTDIDINLTATNVDGSANKGIVIRVRVVLGFDGQTIVGHVFTIGSGVNALLPAATGSDTITYSLSPALPAGLSFSSATRRITGTPTAPIDETEYTYTATAGAESVSLTFGIEVNYPPIIFSPTTIADQTFIIGTAVDVLMPSAAGGSGGISYGFSPALPAGLSFSQTTRRITGTPAASNSIGGTTYQYQADDSATNREVIEFDINIRAAVNFGSNTIADQTWDTDDVINLLLPAGSGGRTPLTYALTPALPAGLSFSQTTRRITGTSTTRHDETEYTYTVTDADSVTATLNFNITVTAPPITFSPGTIARQNLYVGTPYSRVFPEASGGIGTFDYAIRLNGVNNTPADVHFTSNNRTLAGTPTTPRALETYQYRATDDDNHHHEIDFMMAVYAAITFASTQADVSWVSGTAVNHLLPSASGGAGGIEYSLSPALPDGLSFSATTRRITGTPTAMADETEYTLTAEDDVGTQLAQTFNITITEPDPPVWDANIPTVEVDEGGSHTEDLSQYLTDADSVEFDPSYVDLVPDWLTLSGFDLIITNAESVTADEQFNVQLRAFNTGGASDRDVVVQINNLATAPVWDATIATQEINEHTTGTINVTGFVAGEDSIAFASGYSPPSWLTISAGVLSIDGTQAVASDTNFDVELAATNTEGTADKTIVVRVIATAPVWDATIPTYEFDEGESGTVDVGALVTDDATTIEFAQGYTAPSWLTINVLTGVMTIDGTQRYDSDHTENVRISASNAIGTDNDIVPIRILNTLAGVPVWDATIARQDINEGTTDTIDVRGFVSGEDSISFAPGYTPESWLTISGGILSIDGTQSVTQNTDHSVELRATNAGGTADKTIVVRILNVAAPTWHVTIPAFDVNEGANRTIGMSQYLTGATGLEFQSGYTVPSWLSISGLNLIITGAPSVNAETDYSVELRATNAGGGTNRTVTVTVSNVPAVPVWQTTIPAINLEEHTSRTVDLAQYVTGATSVAFDSTYTPPAWITLSGFDLTLTSAPAVTAETSFDVELTATNVDGSADKTIVVTVRDVIEPIDFGGETIPNYHFVIGETVNIGFPEVESAVGGATYTLTPTAPAGLTFNATTRKLTGTPTEVVHGVLYAFTGEDSAGASASIEFRIFIRDTPYTIENEALQTLLPPNATPWERAVETMLRENILPIADGHARMPILDAWSPDSIPEALIPYLGINLSINVDTDLDVADQRELLHQSYDIHHIEGTPQSLLNVIFALGYDGAVIMEGVADTNGVTHWSHYAICINENLTIEEGRRLVRFVRDLAPMRCELVGVEISGANETWNGNITFDGSHAFGTISTLNVL